MRVCAPDCCTLIYFAKAGLLPLLERLFDRIIITNVVWEEVLEGKAEGKVDAFLLEKTVQESTTFTVVKIDSQKQAAELQYFRGPGEASLSVISQQQPNTLILTSDLAAYRKFTRRGVKHLVRSDELVLIVFEKGHYNYQTFTKNLSQLKAVGGTTEQRIAFLQSQAGGKKP